MFGLRRGDHDRGRKLDRRGVRAGTNQRGIGTIDSGRIEIASGNGHVDSIDGHCSGGVSHASGIIADLSTSGGELNHAAGNSSHHAARYASGGDPCRQTGNISAAPGVRNLGRRDTGSNSQRCTAAHFRSAADDGACCTRSSDAGDAIGAGASFWTDASLGVVRTAADSSAGGAKRSGIATSIGDADAHTDQSVSRQRSECQGASTVTRARLRLGDVLSAAAR